MKNEVNLNYALDSQGMRLERTNRRMFILCIILIAALFVSNLGWLYYESQFTDVETTKIEAEQKSDGDGDNLIIGGDYVEGTEGNDN